MWCGNGIVCGVIIVLNNVDTVQGEDELDKAYKEIVKKTDIHPLKLVYIPAGMKFIKIDIGEKVGCNIF